MLTFHIRRFFATNLPKVTSFSQVKDLSPTKLEDADLKEAIRKYKLSSWNYSTQVSHVDVVADGHHKHETKHTSHISKTFHFHDVRHAFAFMDSLAPLIENINHHPEWSQIENEVDVRLNTHDAGNSVSLKDIVLARTMDYVYDQVADKPVKFAVQETTLNEDDVFQKALTEEALAKTEDKEKPKLYEGRGRNDPDGPSKKYKPPQKEQSGKKADDKSDGKSQKAHYKNIPNI